VGEVVGWGIGFSATTLEGFWGTSLERGRGSGGLSVEAITSTGMRSSVADAVDSFTQIRAIGTKISKCRISDPTIAFDHNKGESVCRHGRIVREGDGGLDGEEEGITSSIKLLSLGARDLNRQTDERVG
jgi:hypothetical protein